MIMIPLVIASIETDPDREWMTSVYFRHFRLMKQIASHYADSSADAEDIVSQSCVSLITHMDRLRTMDDEALRHYIATTVRNNGINYRKKNVLDARLFEALPNPDEYSDCNAVSAETHIMLAEEIEIVRQAIHKLPERQQIILKQKIFDGDTDANIAEQLGISENSVRKYLQRARRALIKALYGGDDHESGT